MMESLGPILAESVDPAREITTKLCFSFPLPGWLCEEDRGLNKIVRTVSLRPFQALMKIEVILKCIYSPEKNLTVTVQGELFPKKQPGMGRT